MKFFRKITNLKTGRTKWSLRKRVATFLILCLVASGLYFTAKEVMAVDITLNGTTQTLTYAGGPTYNYDSITISNGGVLTIEGGVTVNVAGNISVTGTNSKIVIQGKDKTDTAAPWTGVGVVINVTNSGNVEVGSGAYITADNEGYQGGAVGNSGYGPGKGLYVSVFGAGAGYGGDGRMTGDRSAAGGAAYEISPANAPLDLGSGGAGGGGGTAPGGHGGGAIKLNIAGDLTNNGTISANGQNGVATACNHSSGGGSGGSLWIIADDITGGGTISAKGGNAYRCGAGDAFSGSGGGGRISITTTNAINLSSGGTITAAAGYMDHPSQSDITAQGGTVVINSTNSVTLASASIIGRNVSITTSGASAGLSLDASSLIKADYYGSFGGFVSNGSGTGAGTYGAGVHGGGAGYGGAGSSASATAAAGGTTYGDENSPTDYGSGAGSGGGDSTSAGGNGGGVIKLDLNGNLTLNGLISANGQNGGSTFCNHSGGGGSGGSVWIIADDITGGGDVTAIGGNGFRCDNTFWGGAGGGGRISITAVSLTMSSGGSISAAAGYMDHSTQNDVSAQGGTVIINSTNSIELTSAGITGGKVSITTSGAGAGLSLDASSSIVADYYGSFGGIERAGYGTGGGGTSTVLCGGGGYGGAGRASSDGAGVAGTTYGSSTDPADYGSGGGGSTGGGAGTRGGNGGGVIKLNLTGNLTLNGTLTADGQGGNSAFCNHSGGGGSGGSIWVIANEVSGTGNVTATGGEGYICGASYYGGDGGGGRIRFTKNAWSATLASLTAAGGSGANVATTGSYSGLGPYSRITIPGSAFLNGTPTLSGTAASIVGTLQRVEVLIKDNTDNKCWTGAAWSDAGACPADGDDWPDATGTTSWTYAPGAIYTANHNYTVRTKAIDNSSDPNETPGVGHSFTYRTVGAAEIKKNVEFTKDTEIK